MNTKAFFPCGEGSNLILGTGRKNQTIIFNTYIIFEKKIRMEKFLLEKNLSGKQFCKKKFCWKNICQKKYLFGKKFIGKIFYQKVVGVISVT